jgi:hypothetical protein
VGTPSDEKPESVGEIVSGIGQQRDRMRLYSIGDLDRDEAKIQRCSDRESRSKTFGRVAMTSTGMAVIMIVSVIVVHHGYIRWTVGVTLSRDARC